MKVLIKRIDTDLPLPKYETEGAVAFDLYARKTVEVAPRSIDRIPTNLIIQVPENFMLYVKDRSSTAKKGLIATAGVIDQDYCGPDDEILFQVLNYTDTPVTIERGQRIAQALLISIEKADIIEVSHDLKAHSRGGFGSTG